MKYQIHVSGEQPLNKHFMLMERNLHDSDVIGSVHKDIIVWAENRFSNIYWSEEDINQIYQESEKLLEHATAKNLIEEANTITRNYWEKVNNILEEIEKPITQEKLADLYDDYSPLIRRIMAYFLATGEKMTHAVENELRVILARHLPGEFENVYALVTTPSKPDLFYKELTSWLRVVKDPTQELILEHTQKHSIMLPNTYSKEEVIEWARKRLKNKSGIEIENELSESHKRKNDILKKQAAIHDKLNSEKVKELSWFIQECALVRLLIKACWNGEGHHLLTFYRRIAELAGCPVKDLHMIYTRPEIQNLLRNNKKLSKDEIDERKKYNLIHFSNGKISVYSGDKALEMKRRLLDPHIPVKQISSLKGQIANKGKVRGPVKVIKTDTPSEMQKIAKELTPEHILVAGMTNPAMMVLIKKIKGIITDEGGIACHAAIISREFGIPCVVATRMATQIFKDDDIVELDADNGIVRKL